MLLTHLLRLSGLPEDNEHVLDIQVTPQDAKGKHALHVTRDSQVELLNQEVNDLRSIP